MDVFDHTSERQLLYFKERFLEADDPQRARLLLVSNTLRRLGISDSVFGGPDAGDLIRRLHNLGEAELAIDLCLDGTEDDS